MARFENIQVFGPGMSKSANGTDEVGGTAVDDTEVSSPVDTTEARPALDDFGPANGLYSDVAAFVNANRRLAIFGAFAIGVFLGSFSRS